ncbi:hypothetical protein H9P43_007043 [Blastocladiella emersonii ATCC 22665]|nr:hypothetical protein H9P43_007043 [Blastocladiella emersonii ATCC 22665]
MPNNALCVGMTYGSELAGSDVDAYNMAGLAGQLGIENVETLTDTHTSVVTPDDVLNSLRSMVDNAQPGDTLLFSFSGMGGQSPDATGAEADGQNEFLAVSDGVITDDEIRAILADLPADVNCTMVMDAGHTGTIGDLDLSGAEIAGNVVCLSSTNDAGTASLADAMGSPFTNAVVNVMTDSANSGVSWADAAALIDAELGNEEPTVVASANRTELLFEPVFGGADLGNGGEHDGHGRALARDVASEHDDPNVSDPADEAMERGATAADDLQGDVDISRGAEASEDPYNDYSANDDYSRGSVTAADDLQGDNDFEAREIDPTRTIVGVDTNGDGRIDVVAWTDHNTGISRLNVLEGDRLQMADNNHDGLVDSNYTAGTDHVVIPAGMNIAAYVDAQQAAGMEIHF